MITSPQYMLISSFFLLNGIWLFAFLNLKSLFFFKQNFHNFDYEFFNSEELFDDIIDVIVKVMKMLKMILYSKV